MPKNFRKRNSIGTELAALCIKRQRSIPEITMGIGGDENETWEETEQLVEEPEIHKTQATEDEVGLDFGRFVDKGKGLFNILNNLAEGIFQKPSQVKDVGTPLHMKNRYGNGVPMHIRVRQVEDGFEICHIENESCVVDKLRVGDRIVCINEEDMAQKSCTDILEKVWNDTVSISIKRNVNTEDGIVHTVVFTINITFDDTIKFSVIGIDTCGRYRLLVRHQGNSMCIYRDDKKRAQQYFMTFTDRTVSAEVGGTNDTSQRDKIMLRIYYLQELSNFNKQVWMLKHDEMFINAKDSNTIELIDGVGELKPNTLANCDARAFIYSTYPNSHDSFRFESMEFPGHYLAIDGNNVKLINIKTEDGFKTTEGYKCQLEVTSIKHLLN